MRVIHSVVIHDKPPSKRPRIRRRDENLIMYESHALPICNFLFLVVSHYVLSSFLNQMGMNTYMYAQKYDAKHRAFWRYLYSTEEAGTYKYYMYLSRSTINPTQLPVWPANYDI